LRRAAGDALEEDGTVYKVVSLAREKYNAAVQILQKRRL
jgi:hypothetical protein